MTMLNTYKNLGPGPIKVVDGATGDGGLALTDDLKAITDAILNAQTSATPSSDDPTTVYIDQTNFGTFDIDLGSVSGSALTLVWGAAPTPTPTPTPTEEGVHDGQEITLRVLQASSETVSLAFPSNVDFGPFTYMTNSSGTWDLLKLKWNEVAGTWQVFLISRGFE